MVLFLCRILFAAAPPCIRGAAALAGIFADILLNIIKDRHQRLAVRGQPVFDPGRDFVVVDPLDQTVRGQLLELVGQHLVGHTVQQPAQLTIAQGVSFLEE